MNSNDYNKCNDMRQYNVSGIICWVGGFPAHYTRKMHLKLEEELGESIRFTYVLKNKKGNEREYERGNLPCSSIIIDSRDWLNLWKSLKTSSPQIVILAGHYPRLVLIALLWAFLHKRRVAYWSDTNILDVRRKKWFKRNSEFLLKKVLFRWIDTFLYIGTRNRDFYEAIVGRRRLEGKLIKMPLPALLSDKTRTVSEEKIIKFLFLGRLVSLKCVDNLLKAIAILPRQAQKQLMMTIAGDGPERNHLKVLAENLKISGIVQFLGAVSSDETHLIYVDHDIFILPSRNEAWALVVNEALSSGLPVVIPYWVGAVPDLVIQGYTGFVMEDNEPETISRAIQKVIKTDSKKLFQMGEHGRDLVITGGFHLDSAKDSLIHYLNKTIT